MEREKQKVICNKYFTDTHILVTYGNITKTSKQKNTNNRYYTYTLKWKEQQIASSLLFITRVRYIDHLFYIVSGFVVLKTYLKTERRLTKFRLVWTKTAVGRKILADLQNKQTNKKSWKTFVRVFAKNGFQNPPLGGQRVLSVWQCWRSATLSKINVLN